MSLRGTILGLFVAGVAAVGAGYLVAFTPAGEGRAGAALLVSGTALALVAAMALGALKDGALGGLLPVFGFVLVAVGGGLGALLLLPAADPADPTLVLGLPPRAALLLYGVGLVPVLVVPFAYARTFDRFHLSEADLERIRRASDGRGSSREGVGPEGRDSAQSPAGREGSGERAAG